MSAANDSTMSSIQAAIWQFLRDRYVGPDNASPRAAIISRYNLLHSKTIEDREFRETVSDLVVVFKKPICTSPAGGYYVARTFGELTIGVNYLEGAGSKFFERARALKETIPLETQESLF